MNRVPGLVLLRSTVTLGKSGSRPWGAAGPSSAGFHKRGGTKYGKGGASAITGPGPKNDHRCQPYRLPFLSIRIKGLLHAENDL